MKGKGLMSFPEKFFDRNFKIGREFKGEEERRGVITFFYSHYSLP